MTLLCWNLLWLLQIYEVAILIAHQKFLLCTVMVSSIGVLIFWVKYILLSFISSKQLINMIE